MSARRCWCARLPPNTAPDELEVFFEEQWRCTAFALTSAKGQVFDRTGCPIVIVGLPRILRVINRHEKFVSRIGLHMEFLPLTQEEVLTTVLPALTLPYWQY